MTKLPISIGIMSWRDTDSLSKLLVNFKKQGLFKLSDDIHVLLQDGTQEDIDVVKKYPELRYTVVENLGNGGGISYLCKHTKYDYFFFLENDWFIHEENNIYKDVERSLDLLKRGFTKVDLRSIKKPGWANLVGTSPAEIERSGKPRAFWDVIAFMFLHWIEGSPSEVYPGIIEEGEDYVWGDSLYFPWGDNPFMIHKSLIMNNWEGFNQKLSPEMTMMNWWRQQHFKVARLKDGPFYHFDAKKYNPLLRNLFDSAIEGVKAGFSYSPHAEGFELRGVVFTDGRFRLDSAQDTYFIGTRPITPAKYDNKSHIYELNTYHEFIKDLRFIISPEEINNDLIINTVDGNTHNLGTIKSLLANEFDLHKPERDLIVVENFYLNPYEIREYALSMEFKESEWHKGRRTHTKYYTPFMKEKFEEILGKKITKWEEHGWNGVFQYCTSEDKLVYHVDSQQYAAVLFLTPEAPPQTGTTFFRCKETGNYGYENGDMGEEYQTSFRNGYYDKTPFEEIDRVGNKFNRLVIFNARQIHAATEYFGNGPRNSRLFQIFFFDAE